MHASCCKEDEADQIRICTICEEPKANKLFSLKYIKKNDCWYRAGQCLVCENTVESMTKKYKRPIRLIMRAVLILFPMTSTLSTYMTSCLHQNAFQPTCSVHNVSYIREWGENYTQKWKDLKKNKEGFKALVVTNSDANKDRPTVRRIVHDKEYLQASRGKRKEHRIRRPKRPFTYPSWIKHAMSEDGGGYNQSLSIINPKLHK